MNDNTEREKNTIHLSVLTPSGCLFDGECDSFTFEIADGADGSYGGSVGIHPGHLPAVAALAEKSHLVASFKGKTVFEAVLCSGAAKITPYRAILLTEKE